MIWETNCAGANSENKQTGTEMLGVPTELEQNETAEHGSPRCSSRGTGTMLLALCTQEAVGSSVPSVLLPPPPTREGEREQVTLDWGDVLVTANENYTVLNSSWTNPKDQLLLHPCEKPNGVPGKLFPVIGVQFG